MEDILIFWKIFNTRFSELFFSDNFPKMTKQDQISACEFYFKYPFWIKKNTTKTQKISLLQLPALPSPTSEAVHVTGEKIFQRKFFNGCHFFKMFHWRNVLF